MPFPASYRTLPPPVTRATFLHETDCLSGMWECLINWFPVSLCAASTQCKALLRNPSALHIVNRQLSLTHSAEKFY